jgi:hypothetical protein
MSGDGRRPGLTVHRVILTLPPGAKGDRTHPTAQALRQVNLEPALPPQGILVVRKLRPNSPLDSTWQTIRTWERQTQAQLNQNWRTAARPAQGPVPTTANAVWFADTAEWLACLSWDIFQGTARQHWWWQSWLKHPQPSPGHTLFALWQPEVRWLPHTLRWLYTHHGQTALAIIAQLTDHQATTLTHQLHQTYHLPPSPHLPISPSPYPPTHLPTYPHPSHQTLTHLCLTLAYVPTSLRQSPTTTQPPQTQTQTADTPLSGQSPSPLTTLPTDSQDDSLDGIDPVSTDTSIAPLLPNHELQSPTADEAAPDVLPPSPLPESPSPAPSSKPPHHPPKTNQPNSPNPHPTIPPPHHPTHPSTHPLTHPPTSLPTHLGGLWYLINLLTPLHWPHPDLCPNPWHQLHTLARHLLPEPTPDPVWQLLLDLSETDLPDTLTPWLNATLPEIHDYLTTQLPHPLTNPPTHPPTYPPTHLPSLSPHLPTPAHIHPSRTHIDIVFSLEHISLDLRLAGLDRNPGWVPELARVITFHYQ